MCVQLQIVDEFSNTKYTSTTPSLTMQRKTEKKPPTGLFILFAIIHGIASIAHWMQRQFLQMKSMIVRLARIVTFRGNPETSKNLKRILDQCLHDRPLHVCIAAPLSEVDEHELLNAAARAVCWCAIGGAPFISVYDSHGVLFKESQKRKYIGVFKDSKSGLSRMISDHAKKIASKDAPSFVCVEPLTQDRPRLLEPQESRRGAFRRASSGGNTTMVPSFSRDSLPHQREILVLTEEDGKEDIVHAARNVCKEVMKGTVQPEDISQDGITSMLTALPKGYPNPQVVFVFGEVTTLGGLMPWQTCAAEIVTIGPPEQFSIVQFERGIARFAAIEQRWGK